MRWELYNRLLRRADRYMRWKNFTSIDGKDAHDFAIDALRAEGVELRRIHFDMVDAIRRELGRRGGEGRERVRSERPRQFLDGDRKWFDPEPERDWFDAWSYWLSPRQREVALMLSEGLRKQDVAARIGVTPARVSQIVQDIERIYTTLIEARQKEDGTMTMFTAFTEQFRKQDICLFSDFIGDTAPLGVVPTATTQVSIFSFSNTNTDTQQPNQPLGTMTMTVPSAANSAVGVYPAIGVYPAAPIAAGGSVNRDFRVGRGEIDFEARLKSVANNANVCVTFGIGLPTDTGGIAATHLAGFYAFGTDSNWTAALIVNGSIVRSVATSVSKTVFSDFRVFLDADANRAKLYANGTLVATFDGQLPTNAGLLPHIEIRDRTQTGSLASAQSVEADYMLVKLKANR